MILLLLSLISSLFALECSIDTTLVEFKSQFSHEKTIFCQKSHQGQLVKHGKEIVLNKNGSTKSTRTFILGREVTPSKRPQISLVTADSKKEIKELIHHIIFNVFHYTPNREVNITSKRTGRCPDDNKKRIRLLTKNKSYSIRWKFNKNCHLDGLYKVALDKETTLNFKTKNIRDFTSLKLIYTMRKSMTKGRINLLVTIREAILKNLNNSKRLVFNSDLKVNLNPVVLMTSKGKRGITIEKFYYKVTHFNGTNLTF